MIVHFHGPKPERCLDRLVVMLQRYGRSVTAPYGQCGCPDIYVLMFCEAVDRDGGEMYTLSLLNFYRYLLDSRRI